MSLLGKALTPRPASWCGFDGAPPEPGTPPRAPKPGPKKDGCLRGSQSRSWARHPQMLMLPRIFCCWGAVSTRLPEVWVLGLGKPERKCEDGK